MAHARKGAKNIESDWINWVKEYRCQRSEVGSKEAVKKLFRYTNARFLGLVFVILLSGLLLCRQVTGQQAVNTRLVVMTYNIGTLNGERIGLDKIVKTVKRKVLPDLLLLQEVPGEKEACDLAKNLGFKQYVYSNYESGKNGLAIMSCYALCKSGIIYLNKYAAFAAEILINGRSVMVCSVHLERIRPIEIKNNMFELPWKTALQFLLTELTQDTPRSRAVDKLLLWLATRQSGYIIVGGDFNTVPFSKCIRKMEKVFDDVLWPSLDYFTGSYRKISLAIKPRIDYIFHSPDLKCNAASVIREGAGDHCPVLAVFEL